MRKTSLANKPITIWESRIFAALSDAAENGRPCPIAEELSIWAGCSAISTTVRLVQRLEQRGLIKVESYQRARRVTIVATGKSTAAVTNPAPHWRVRPRPITLPGPSIAQIRGRSLDFAREVMSAARTERMEIGEFLAELAWHGWQVREAAIQDQATGD